MDKIRVLPNKQCPFCLRREVKVI